MRAESRWYFRSYFCFWIGGEREKEVHQKCHEDSTQTFARDSSLVTNIRRSRSSHIILRHTHDLFSFDDWTLMAQTCRPCSLVWSFLENSKDIDDLFDSPQTCLLLCTVPSFITSRLLVVVVCPKLRWSENAIAKTTHHEALLASLLLW